MGDMTDRMLDMLEKGKVSLTASVLPAGEGEAKPLEVQINLHGQPLPEQHGEMIDLCTAEDAMLKAGEVRRIDLGVSMQLPDGYCAVMTARSSICEKYGIIQANSVGIFDHDYCGDGDRWGFLALAVRETFIPKGTRIAQFQLARQAQPVIFKPVDALGNKDRGGWGSTGEKTAVPTDDWKKGLG